MKFYVVGLLASFALTFQIAVFPRTVMHRLMPRNRSTRPITTIFTSNLFIRMPQRFIKTSTTTSLRRIAPLIVNDIHVESNDTELRGADAYVKGISRFIEPFRM